MAELDLKNYKNRHSLKSKIGRVVWNVVWALFFRTTPRWCLNGWRCFLLRLFGANVGKGVRIQGGVKIWQPWKLIIGENTWIDGGVSLYSVDVISIGDNTVISNGAFICTASHDISSKTFELVTKPILIEDSVWICSKTMLMPGVKVSEGAVVAAGSVVTKDVEPWTVVGGNPAKVIKKREISS